MKLMLLHRICNTGRALWSPNNATFLRAFIFFGRAVTYIIVHFALIFIDSCYVLSFSIIMLNTSLHNPNVKEKVMKLYCTAIYLFSILANSWSIYIYEQRNKWWKRFPYWHVKGKMFDNHIIFIHYCDCTHLNLLMALTRLLKIIVFITFWNLGKKHKREMCKHVSGLLREIRDWGRC